MPYQSPRRCSLGRISWKGVSAKERVPAGARESSWAQATALQPRIARIVTSPHIRAIVRACTSISLVSFFAIKTNLSGSRRIAPAIFLPKAKSSQESIGVVARSATWRKLFQLLDVAPPQNHVFGFKSGNQTGDPVPDPLPPFRFAQTGESAGSNVIFEGVQLVREMAKLHGFHDAVHDHGGTGTGP